MMKFKRAFRGYNKHEVDLEFEDMDSRLSNALDSGKELKLQVSSLKEQNLDLKDRVKEYERIEKDLRDAFISGQQMANRIMEEATIRAEEIVSSARVESDSKGSEIETLTEQIQILMDKKIKLQTSVDRAMGYLESAKSELY